MKECSQDHGNAGDYCTFTYSNFAAIKVGSKVFFDQATGIPAGCWTARVCTKWDSYPDGTEFVGVDSRSFGNGSMPCWIL